MRGGEQSKSFSLPSQMRTVPPQATLSRIFFGVSSTLSRHLLCVELSFPFADYGRCMVVTSFICWQITQSSAWHCVKCSIHTC